MPRFWEVYPRECGGTIAYECDTCGEWGLSPRVRGNPEKVFPPVLLEGSIPASAGEPNKPIPQASHQGVYPRECGGTVRGARWLVVVPGLSPRVRGNRVGAVHHPVEPRSIPASAGEPVRHGIRTSHRPVYPRECGGTIVASISSDPKSGLSPRVRGNPAGGRLRPAGDGSIPASAGEPPPWIPTSPGRRVYPRECGGTIRVMVCPVPYSGLSPRVRGNLRGERLELAALGSIPASAGEPSSGSKHSLTRTVYPRECGGTPLNRSVSNRPDGLSPRVRGNRGRPSQHG